MASPSRPDRFRQTTQDLAPAVHGGTSPGCYDIYPAFDLPPGCVHRGFDALAEALAHERAVRIDGFSGVLWDDLRQRLDAALRAAGTELRWIDVRGCLVPPTEIDRLVAPYLGGDDPLWGTRFTDDLAPFFDAHALARLEPDPAASLTILFGPGAGLVSWDSPLVYVDVPKNEIQFRSRAGSIAPLGVERPLSAKEMYKHFYFVEWPAMNRHRHAMLPRIDVVVDAQRPDDPTWMHGPVLRDALDAMATGVVRPRPWFEPGPWGGQWIKRHIPALPQDAPNYAWSFELIAPENGIAVRSEDTLLEVAFDTLLHHAAARVLGRAHERFGVEFPIRFDFLDTVEGGNLSVQCHPRPEYITHHFGESFTQDETYYILDTTPGARVYLGFRDDADTDAFRRTLEHSRETGSPADIDVFVNSVEARRHELLLIPHGTIHGSGAGNLVLEISATPYIFTFKMYDWVRRDLDGNLRPINIERAWENLFFDRTAARIDAEFISRPDVIAEGDDWRIVHLPTHPDHFYDVVRYEFDSVLDADTDDTVHVLSLVDGTSILVETPNGTRQRINYAETFIVPAAARRYRLINEGDERAMVVRAWVKQTERERDKG